MENQKYSLLDSYWSEIIVLLRYEHQSELIQVWKFVDQLRIVEQRVEDDRQLLDKRRFAFG